MNSPAQKRATDGESPMLELPHTHGCLACGQNNPHGLRLRLSIDPDTARVRVPFTPAIEHIGFNGIVHGGILATVLDEAMAWAAAWPNRRFGLCGELTVRYRQSAVVGVPMIITASVASNRPRLIQTTAEVRDERNNLLAAATGKYIPLPPEDNQRMLETLIREPQTAQAYQWLLAPLNENAD